MKSIKVLFISPSFYPATYYGGPTFINKALCDALAVNDKIELEVLTTDSAGPSKRICKAEQQRESNYSIRYCRRMISPDIAPGLLLRLFGMIRRADVVHLNAVYSFTTIPTLVLCKLLRKPVVWSLHGALQSWAGEDRSRLKRIWNGACDVFCDRGRVFIHAATLQEQAEIGLAIGRAESIVIRYGVEVPQLTFHEHTRAGALRLIYLGRLHPIKGIENLLRALALTKEQTTLRICGEGDPTYQARLRELSGALGLDARVQFHGYLPEEAKEKFFQESDICIIPSFRESFGAVVAEALARGVPVIASRGTPWQRIEEVGCGLWVENSPEELAAAIDRAAALPLREMGQRGRKWIEQEFAWTNSAREMIDLYKQLIRCEPAEDTEVATCVKAA